jgi:hypothetical protein
LHINKELKDIINEKNEKFFQYYRTTDENNNLYGFGVKVQTYDDTYKKDLIRIEKKWNSLYLGYDESEYKSYTTKFHTNIVLDGFIQIYNTTGLQIYSKRSDERTNLRCDDGGVYFMDYDTPSSGDIFFQKGLRFKSEENLKIQKPYTNYQSNINNEITIPYGTDLTNLGTDMTNLEARLSTLESGSGSGSNNLITFRQSLIDHTTINSRNGDLFQAITTTTKYPTTIKTSIGEEVFPKTTNTLLTVYYSSYIKTFKITQRPLISYYCENDNAAIVISVDHYTGDPKLKVRINTSNGDRHKEFIVTPSESKVVIDLTAELAVARPNEEITSAKFSSELYDSPELFYQYCINTLNNIFISYTYED